MKTDVTKNSGTAVGESGARAKSHMIPGSAKAAAAVQGQFWFKEVTRRKGSLTSK